MLNLFDDVKGNIPISVPGPQAGGLPGSVAPAQFAIFGIYNWNATSDPGPTNDSSQGVIVGHVWRNSTAGALRIWSCHDNTAGAAKWVFEGADYVNGGTNPAIEVTQFGSGAALMAEEGNIFRYVSAGLSPAGTNADYVVAAYSLPANSFDGLSGTNRGISITAQGNFLNASNKTVKIIIGATAPVVGSVVSGGTTIGSIAGVTGNGGWIVAANVFKYGASGSNTQLGIHESAQFGSTVGTLVAPSALTLTENAAIPIAITANDTTLASDITLAFAQINAMN